MEPKTKCVECGINAPMEGAKICCGCSVEMGKLVTISERECVRMVELEKFIADAAGFIAWAFQNNREDTIRTTLIHDIMGLDARERCFCPRVSGYADIMRKEAKRV